MNYNGKQMYNANAKANKRKRNEDRVQSETYREHSSKRLRFTNNPNAGILPFHNPFLNHTTVQNSGKVSIETLNIPQLVHKSPTNDKPQQQTSPYDPFQPRISPLQQRTSPSNPSKPRTSPYSANDRLKSLKRTFVTDVAQPVVKNNNSCSNLSRGAPIPPLIAKPSSIQERLKNLKNYYNNANSSGLVTPSTTKPQENRENVMLISPPSAAAFANDNSYDDSMDWCAFEEKEVLDNITQLRKNITPQMEPLTTFQKAISDNLVKMDVNQSMYRGIFIVTDTNVLISNLSLIYDLLELKINGVCNPCIMIPWTVIQELDYLKDSDRQNNINNSAQKAIKFINEKLSKKDPQVKGQSVHDAGEQNFASKNADDAILFCCLQIKERQHNSILLSNDINLRNKAMINGITAYSHKTIMDGLDPYRDTGNGLRLQPGFDYSKLKAVEVIFSSFFSFIINTKTLDAYGSSRDRMYPQLKQSSQWPLIKCLNFFKKFWRSIFCMFLPRQFMYTVNQFIEFLTKHEDLEVMTPSNIKTFVDTGLELIVYIQNGCVSNRDSAVISRKKIEDITKDFFVSQD